MQQDKNKQFNSAFYYDIYIVLSLLHKREIAQNLPINAEDGSI